MLPIQTSPLRFGTVFTIRQSNDNDKQARAVAQSLLENLLQAGISEAKLGGSGRDRITVLTDTQPGQDARMSTENEAFYKTRSDCQKYAKSAGFSLDEEQMSSFLDTPSIAPVIESLAKNLTNPPKNPEFRPNYARDLYFQMSNIISWMMNPHVVGSLQKVLYLRKNEQ